MRVHNPGNWHWTNKDCTGWSSDWLREKLVGLSAEKEGTNVRITNLASCVGDVSVSQRKGKLVTLFDLALKVDFAGQTERFEGQVSGNVHIPEVAYDSAPEDYVFEIDISEDSAEKEPVRSLIRSDIVPKMRDIFRVFSSELVKTHGLDVFNPAAPAGGAMPQPVAQLAVATATPNASVSNSYSKPGGKTPSVVNTTDLTNTIEFQAPASELYRTFIDPSRVALWTRSAPVFTPGVGERYAFFGGNVHGEILNMQPDKLLEMSWRIKAWPEDHYARLKLVFDQGVDSTKLRVSWFGIPVGQEKVVQKNFREYYSNPIMQIFGFGAVL